MQRVEVVPEWRRRNRGEEKGAEGRRLYRNRKAHDGASCCASFVSYINGGVRARENGPTAQCGYSASLRVRASHVLRATGTGIPPCWPFPPKEHGSVRAHTHAHTARIRLGIRIQSRSWLGLGCRCAAQVVRAPRRCPSISWPWPPVRTTRRFRGCGTTPVTRIR